MMGIAKTTLTFGLPVSSRLLSSLEGRQNNFAGKFPAVSVCGQPDLGRWEERKVSSFVKNIFHFCTDRQM